MKSTAFNSGVTKEMKNRARVIKRKLQLQEQSLPKEKLRNETVNTSWHIHQVEYALIDLALACDSITYLSLREGQKKRQIHPRAPRVKSKADGKTLIIRVPFLFPTSPVSFDKSNGRKHLPEERCAPTQHTQTKK